MSIAAPSISIDSAAPWQPVLVDGFQLGPARWDGQSVLSDVSVQGQRRILRIGLRERLILEQIDGRRTVSELRASMNSAGFELSEASLLSSLNRLLAYGILRRPFELAPQRLRALDEQAKEPAQNLKEVWAASPTNGPLGVVLSQLAKWPVFTIAAAGALTIFALTVLSAPLALRAILDTTSVWWLVASVAIAACWNISVTLAHEVAHAGTFRALSHRPAHMSITRLGAVPMLNTQLDGLGLLSASEKFRVVASGPLFSLLAMGVPLLLWTFTSPGSFWNVLAAIALAVDLLVVSLALSFFPNTDGTRILEAISSVDQLQAVAFRTLFRKLPLPRALPAVTRITVRVYPVLLAATVLTVLLVGVFTTVVALG